MSATPARHAALEVMRRVRQGDLADRALGRVLPELAERDRAWVQELVYGTLRLRGRLDHLLAERVHRGLDGLEADVLDVLRLGAYQLLEMGGVPAYAAVSESVELAKSVSRGGAGLVNAVLKAVRRGETAAAFPSFETDPAAHLSSWGSHPRWLVERWMARFGADATRRLVAWNNTRPDIFLRPLGVTVEAAAAAVAAAGVGVEVAGPETLRLDAGADVGAALAAVPAVVQDPAAGLVVRCAAPEPGQTVVDLCAAPGGKALALAAGGAGHVVAGDVSLRRQRRLSENTARLAGQLDAPLPLSVLVADARRPALASAALVLVDAPCTGTGTLRRHPDGRWRIGAADLAALVALQREILDAAAALVRPGGVLVYATCSLEPEENGGQVAAFLERSPGFEAEVAPLDARWLDDAGRLAVTPQDHDMDGAFAARLRRKT